MNDIQQALMQLRTRGWTLVAIGKELNIPASTIRKWSAGRSYPANPSTVMASFMALYKTKARHKVQKKPAHAAVEQELSPEVRAGLGLFKDLAPERSLVDELIQERRREAASE